VISTVDYTKTGAWNKYKEITTAITDPGGRNDLYFVFKKDTAPNEDICSLDWLEFKK
jgi:cytochrome c